MLVKRTLCLHKSLSLRCNIYVINVHWMEISSGRLSWSSLETLKASCDVLSDDLGDHPVSVYCNSLRPDDALIDWGRVTHICVSELTIIGSDNGLSPGRRQAIIWNNAGLLLIEPFRNKLQWNFTRNSNTFIQENALEHVVCEMASILSRPQCVNLSVHVFDIFRSVLYVRPVCVWVIV